MPPSISQLQVPAQGSGGLRHAHGPIWFPQSISSCNTQRVDSGAPPTNNPGEPCHPAQCSCSPAKFHRAGTLKPSLGFSAERPASHSYAILCFGQPLPSSATLSQGSTKQWHRNPKMSSTSRWVRWVWAPKNRTVQFAITLVKFPLLCLLVAPAVRQCLEDPKEESG